MCLCTRILPPGGFCMVEILLSTNHSISWGRLMREVAFELIHLMVEVYLFGIKIKKVQLRFLASGEESLFIVMKQYMLQGR